MKSKIAAALLAMTAIAPAMADNFTYLSGGLLSDDAGIVRKINQKIDQEFPQNDPANTSKGSRQRFGFYLNGSLGLRENLFIEGRLQHTEVDQQALLGIGVHCLLSQWSEIYALAGAAQKAILLSQPVVSNQGEPKRIEALSNYYKDKIQPTVEIGTKLRLGENSAFRLAYRYGRFGDDKALQLFLEDDQLKTNKNLHSIHLSGCYQVAENCALELGYEHIRYLNIKETTEQESFKFLRGNTLDHKIMTGIRYSF
ncbi:MAG: hypothetical protein AAHH96_05020 [Candidatus Symbiodolus clandestinus]